jgi:tetratricopeptide (TPR) repeat protein
MRIFVLVAALVAVSSTLPGRAIAAGAAATQQGSTDDINELREVDFERLSRDADYAATLIRRIDTLANNVRDPNQALLLDHYKAIALAASNRGPEARKIATRLIRRGGKASQIGHRLQISIARVGNDRSGLLRAIVEASSDPDASERVLEVLDGDVVPHLRYWLVEQKDEAGEYRLAEAVLRLGWKSETDPVQIEWFRREAVMGRLARGDVAGAKALLKSIEHPDPLLAMLVSRKYDVLFESEVDRVALFTQALDLEGARSGRDLNSRPHDPNVLLRRIQHLGKLGEHQQILTLTQPYVEDWETVSDKGEPARWAINHRALAFARLGKHDEAVAVMKKLSALDLKTFPDVVGMAINYGAFLNSAGRHADAAEHATRLASSAGKHASAYGHMWIWASAICAFAGEGRPADAAPWLAKLQAGRADNPSALRQALLCLDRLDDAEAVVIEQLAGGGSVQTLRDFQDFREPVVPESEYDKRMRGRFEALAARPAVKAAIDKVGRILPLPIQGP